MSGLAVSDGMQRSCERVRTVRIGSRVAMLFWLCRSLDLFWIQGIQYVVARAIHGQGAIAHHQSFVHGVKHVHAVGDKYYGAPPAIHVGVGLYQRRFAAIVEVGIRFVQTATWGRKG